MLVQAVQCGLTIEQFWEMTWRDWSIYSIAHQRQELNEWARTRNLAYIVYLSSTSEKTPKSLKSFWHLPIIDDVENEDEERTMITDDQLARTLKLYGVN